MNDEMWEGAGRRKLTPEQIDSIEQRQERQAAAKRAYELWSELYAIAKRQHWHDALPAIQDIEALLPDEEDV